jgi:hypothetical protein
MTSPRMATAAEVGTAVGLYLGARAAEKAIFERAVGDALHAQLQAAGICNCDDGAVKAPAELPPLRERILELLAYHSNFVPADLLRKALENNDDDGDQLDPGVEREARQAAEEVLGEVAIAMQDRINQMVANVEAASGQALLAKEERLTRASYCEECGVERNNIGILDHAPSCPNGNPPARRPGWVDAVHGAEKARDEDRHRV